MPCIEGRLGMLLSGLCSRVGWREVGCVIKDERVAFQAAMSLRLLPLLTIEGSI